MIFFKIWFKEKVPLINKNNLTIKMVMNTQITEASGYDINNMVFSKPSLETVPGNSSELKYKRIKISTKNADGSIGELIFPTSQLFSFGVSTGAPNPNAETVTTSVSSIKYSMPLCLTTRDGATPEEEAWIETFNKVVEKCKDHILSVKDDIDQYELERNDLKKLNPLYYKRVKGQIVPGTGPTLYPKLIVSKKQDKIISIFYDENGSDLNPLDLIGKYCYVKAAVKIESIYIGKNISLQVKLHEAEVKVVQVGMRSLLSRPKSDSKVVATSDPLNLPVNKPVQNESKDDDKGSIAGSDDEEEAEPVAFNKPVIQPSSEPEKVTTVKRVVRKVVRH